LLQLGELLKANDISEVQDIIVSWDRKHLYAIVDRNGTYNIHDLLVIDLENASTKLIKGIVKNYTGYYFQIQRVVDEPHQLILLVHETNGDYKHIMRLDRDPQSGKVLKFRSRRVKAEEDDRVPIPIEGGPGLIALKGKFPTRVLQLASEKDNPLLSLINLKEQPERENVYTVSIGRKHYGVYVAEGNLRGKGEEELITWAPIGGKEVKRNLLGSKKFLALSPKDGLVTSVSGFSLKGQDHLVFTTDLGNVLIVNPKNFEVINRDRVLPHHVGMDTSIVYEGERIILRARYYQRSHSGLWNIQLQGPLD